ncbi:MAG: rhomboid family intramembrane serine protease [Chloroflexi bacterium]|nr:rhomboid family intramembrane serine protease [Chloroflexota bacterium]MBT7004078.1 rhomboid family intramembrane serine protease [Chloroflexota bacterium]MBT7077974.1 rhomboid family intramembrane serine protease [Chloroflexota bacterium]MBT7468412.1 rhomboid family intramembrane serine protease [Chloroflexota bacterium]MBT7832761.1 rhomboid family intramembrane serine protease [Chloroflexota bacterium]
MRQSSGSQQSFAASISGSPATSAIAAINIIFFLLVMVKGGPNTQNLVDLGAKYGPYIADGQYFRLFMPMFLHVGFFHLLANMFGLIIFGSMVERTFGTRNFIVIYLTAGVMGNAVSFLAGPNPGAGASGAVFGILGSFGVYLLLNRRLLGQMGRQQLTSIGVIVGINVVMGLATPGIDNAAHFGGLISGGIVAMLISPRERLFAVETPFNFGTPRVALRTAAQPVSRILMAVLIIGVIVVAITWFESGTYVTNMFGQKIPG